jgi:four helix bundle protein
MRDYHGLEVWCASRELAVRVYNITRSFPRAEIYGLTSQIRRAAISIAANIAEGSGRQSDAEMRHFLSIAHGSATELECLLELCEGLGYLHEEAMTEATATVRSVRRMLNAFIRELRSRASRPRPNG